VDRALLVAGLLAAIAVTAILLRRRRAHAPTRVEPRELGLGAEGGVGVVGFSSAYCLPCQAWERALGDAGISFSKIDVAKRPDLVRRYGVRATPLVLAVRLPGGEVLAAFHREPRDGEVERLRELTRAGGHEQGLDSPA
jgi:hypothetical protein